MLTSLTLDHKDTEIQDKEKNINKIALQLRQVVIRLSHLREQCYCVQSYSMT